MLEYTNDFVEWARENLEERALSEYLSNIDPYEFPAMQNLRSELLRVIDDYLSAFPMPRDVIQGDGFCFHETATLIFPVGVRAKNLAEFFTAMKFIDASSIYYHFSEARIRFGKGVDDFSRWIEDSFGKKDLAEQIKAIDPFMHTIEEIRRHIVSETPRPLGRGVSLSQVILKITSPGVPDFYQGSELWHFCLVDPDNRRPVDFRKRMEVLNHIKRLEKEIPLTALAKSLVMNMENGMIKLYLTYKALNYRRDKRELFERGEYLPLEVMGEKAEHICAFARRIGNERVVVAVPRFLVSLVGQPGDLPLGFPVWGESRLIVPISEHGARYRNVFTHEVITAAEHHDATALRLSELFSHFPEAILERQY